MMKLQELSQQSCDKVSIIIPVYNVEKYLGKCLDSVVNQTYSNLQIILVDDGSTDSSACICDEYEKKDLRVEVIHKKNAGLSSARNVGISKATGRFAFYLDSDDYLENNAIEKLIDTQNRYNADIVISNYWYTYIEHEDIAQSIFGDCTVFDNYGAMRALMAGELQTFAWGKFFKTEIVKKYAFPEGKLFEDHFWTHRIFGESNTIVYLNTPMIHYRQREGSISYIYTIERLDVLEGWDDKYQYIEQFYPECKDSLLHNCAEQLVGISWLILTRMKAQKWKAFARLRNCSKKYGLKRYVSGMSRIKLWALEQNYILYVLLAYIDKVKQKLLK